VILVHRLRGEPLLLNADLIESVESKPDTMITLVDGRHLVVAETAGEIASRVRDFRAAVLAAAEGARLGLTNVVEFPGSTTGDG
jgi:flagellar protein FlbD